MLDNLKYKIKLPLFPQPLKDVGHRQLPCLKAVLFYQSTLKSSTIMIHSRQFYQQCN